MNALRTLQVGASGVRPNGTGAGASARSRRVVANPQPSRSPSGRRIRAGRRTARPSAPTVRVAARPGEEQAVGVVDPEAAVLPREGGGALQGSRLVAVGRLEAAVDVRPDPVTRNRLSGQLPRAGPGPPGSGASRLAAGWHRSGCRGSARSALGYRTTSPSTNSVSRTRSPRMTPSLGHAWVRKLPRTARTASRPGRAHSSRLKISTSTGPR